MASAQSNTKGPLASANNLTGWNYIMGVALVNTTAQTWTHNFNAVPAGIMCFAGSATTGGALLATTQPAVTTTVNTIVLTPTSTITVNCLVMWQIPTQLMNGTPTTNFA